MAIMDKLGKFSPKTNEKDERIQRLKRSQATILNKKTPFVIQEAYRTARTNTMFAVADSPEKCKTICVTSANASEGKTTTILNLAITFAQTGSKVLIMDGDLRKPRIHQYLGVVKTDGLTTVLSKQKEFKDVVYHNLRPGLDCLTSGSIPPNPAELLASDAMRNLMIELKEEYDYILIDTPPITVVTDAVGLSDMVTGTILVVREGYTNYESIDQALNLMNMAHTKILGFLVNDINSMSINYGSYRSAYGKGYKYGKSYDNYGYGYGYSYRYADDVRKETNETEPDANEEGSQDIESN